MVRAAVTSAMVVIHLMDIRQINLAFAHRSKDKIGSAAQENQTGFSRLSRGRLLPPCLKGGR